MATRAQVEACRKVATETSRTRLIADDTTRAVLTSGVPAMADMLENAIAALVYTTRNHATANSVGGACRCQACNLLAEWNGEAPDA